MSQGWGGSWRPAAVLSIPLGAYQARAKGLGSGDPLGAAEGGEAAGAGPAAQGGGTVGSPCSGLPDSASPLSGLSLAVLLALGVPCPAQEELAALPVLAALPMLLAQPGQSTHGPTEVCPAPWPCGPAGGRPAWWCPPSCSSRCANGAPPASSRLPPSPAASAVLHKRKHRGFLPRRQGASGAGGRARLPHTGSLRLPWSPALLPALGGGSRRGALWGLRGYGDRGLTSHRWPETGAGRVTNGPCSVEARNGAGWWREAAPVGRGERRAPWPRGQSFLSRQLQISLLLHPFSQPKLMGRSMRHGRPP